MKLCYVLPQYYGDSAENFFHIANFLEELGKKVELYVVIEHSNIKPNIANLEKIYILDDGFKKVSSIYRLIKLIHIYFELYKKGVNVFFARSSLTGVLPLVIANRILNFNRINIVFWSCGQDVVPLSYFPTRKNVKRLVSKFLAWFAFRGINYLATGPELMVDYYHKNYNVPRQKILTLYNDISLTRFHPLSVQEKVISKGKLLSTNKKVILFVHTFNKSRGVDLLPLIAQEIKDRKTDAVIIAIGRLGDYSSELNRQISKYQLQDCFFNLGQVANKDIDKYYKIADLFIMPSRGEGFPRVLLEAMACACPALSFDVGGVANILSHSTTEELLIPLDDEKRFIEQSIRLISDDSLLTELSQKSYKKALHYATANIVEMYTDCLSKIKNA